MHSRSARVHGGVYGLPLGLEPLGLQPEEVLDFSVNTNVYGPCPEVDRAVRAARIDRYPDPTGRRARERLARAAGADPREVVVGNGAADLLWTLARCCARRGATALFVEPTFSEFRTACLASGVPVTEWRATAESDFSVDLDGLARAARRERADVVYLCSPNTPTGTSVPASEIAGWASELRGTLVVLDQSFLSLSERADDAAVTMPQGVVRVRSLTKDHAIPGVRAGYALASPDLVAEMESQQPSWNLSAPAEAAIVAACEHPEFVELSRVRLLRDRDQLVAMLRSVRLHTVPSSTIFFLARVGSASRLQERLLLRHKILVRDCSSFGLPEFVRLAARPEADARALVHALAEELRC